jgi:hypothetical protein
VRRVGWLGGAVAGFVVGALLTQAIQSGGWPVGTTHTPTTTEPPATTDERPATFLAWVPGGLPDGFGSAVAGTEGVGGVTVVAEDNVWLSRSWSAEGQVVDDPRNPYLIPIDAAAVVTRTFAPFLPPADQGVLAALGSGQGILGATSAAQRGLGPGAVLRFSGGTAVRIAAVLPDELVGAAELMVSRATGRRIGIERDRYLLIHPAPGATLTSKLLTHRLRPLLPADLGIYRQVQVRAPGETPYFRAADAVLPPALIKTLFGEFAARPDPGRAGYLDIDPVWVRHHIATTSVPLLGRVTCNRVLIPQLRSAMDDLVAAGLAGLIRTYHGCFAPKFVNRDPSAMLSHHSWGMAFDINLAGNLYGDPPHQDPRLVRILARWGFVWGGTFVVPDGNHFEYRRPPAGSV